MKPWATALKIAVFCMLLLPNYAFALTDPPPNVGNVSASPGDKSVSLSWATAPINCVTDDYRTILILRNTAPIIDRPLDGQTYVVGPDSWIGSSKVVDGSAINEFLCASASTSFGPDTGLANGQRYYYKVFAGSSTAKYASGVQTYATPTGVITSGGTGTILRRTNLGDNTCGGPNNACHNLKTHNSTNTESGYWAGSGGWGSTGTRYGKIVCQTCHQPHSTRNIYVIKETISFPDNSDMPAGAGIKLSTVDYRYREVTLPSVQGSFVMGNDETAASGRPSSSTRICEVCHSQTKYHRYDTSGQLAGNKAHNNARQCTQCHDHQDGFKPGEGGPNCSACHTAQTNPMSGAGPKTYHMVMELIDMTTLSSGIGFGSRYPNKQQPPVGDTHRNCLYCHVEMENYSKKANKSLSTSSGRAYNLRKTILAAPTTTVDISQSTNMDYYSAFVGGGICTSCHLYAQTKDTVKRARADKTINTPVIDPTSYEQTTHNFYVEGGGYASQGETNPDATTFKANCTKCHNDTLGKSYQSATYKFGLHDSPIRRLNAPMNLGYQQGTALRGSTTTITIAGTWTTNYWKGRAITISSGAGSNQTRVISTSIYTVGSTMTTISVFPAWTAADSTSYYLLGDPIEEEVCFRCHSTSTTSNPNANSYYDYYGAKSFKNTRAMKMEQVFGTTNPFGHLIATYGGLHRADEVLAAPVNATSTGWFTDTGTGKHVGCTDCHNPHAARKPGGDAPTNDTTKMGSGTVTSFTSSTANTVTVSDSNKSWTANQWRGYVLRILSGSGAGQDRLIMSNSANTIAVWTSWETYNYLSTNSYYIVSPLGHPQYGNMLSNANDDAWGVTIGANWPALVSTALMTAGSEYMPTQLAGTFFTKAQKLTGNSDKVYNLCFKCHSAYGWGTSGTPFTIPDVPTGTCCATYAVAPSADIAARFNPNNLAHHAVYERGKNQPIKANWNNPNVFSYYNSSWPYWGGPVSSYGTITISSGIATLTVPMVDMINSRPLPVLPGWFVWIGTQDLPNVWSTYETLARSGNRVPGGPTRGWFEITSITSLTQFTVTPAATVASTSGFAITAGFGNTMVPPYGPWSVISCADCHDTDNSTDPSGPHASAQKWILRKSETVDFPWYNGTSVIRIRWKDGTYGGAEGGNIVCINCHRTDVYGTITRSPNSGNAATNNGIDYIGLGVWRGGLSRQKHTPEGSQTQGYGAGTNTYNIVCMLCHGGGAMYAGDASKVGNIHGTSIGRSVTGTGGSVASPASFRGKRFLVGGAWTGLIRSSKTVKGGCWVTGSTTAFANCGNGEVGTADFFGDTANYDFESGADY